MGCGPSNAALRDSCGGQPPTGARNPQMMKIAAGRRVATDRGDKRLLSRPTHSKFFPITHTIMSLTRRTAAVLTFLCIACFSWPASAIQIERDVAVPMRDG